MKLDEALRQHAVPPGSMRYYAWLYAPVPQRDVMAALFLIEAELHETARAAHEVAHIRLQWWRDEFDCLRAGKARHPATQVLQAAAHPGVDFQLLDGVLLSAAQELAHTTYETDVELNHYLQAGVGNLFALASYFLTPSPDSTALTAAVQLGAFVRQVEITRDLRQDFHHGRLYLPLATLDELHIEYQSLQADAWPAAFVQWLQLRGAQSLTAYHTLQAGLSATGRQSLRPLLVLAELHARILKQLATAPESQTRHRIELSPRQKLWTAWRAARRTR